MELDRVDLMLRPPGESTWTTITNQPHTPDDALPIGDVVIDWSRPTPRDQLEPSTITFTLRLRPESPHTRLIALATQVRIIAAAERWEVSFSTQLGPNEVILTHAWITAWSHGPEKDHLGRHTYTVEATDIIGRAAATPIGDTPWPYQNRQDRIARLNAISPSGPLINAIQNVDRTTMLAARDVDNMTALDIAHLCSDPRREHLIPAPSTNISRATYERIPRGTVVNLADHFPTRIPARAIENTGSRLDRQGSVNTISVTFPPNSSSPPEGRSYTHATATFPSRWSVATDRVIAPTSVQTWANAILDVAANPAIRPAAPSRILLDRLDHLDPPNRHHRGAELLHVGDRERQILAVIDAPSDVDQVQSLTGSTITITGRIITLHAHLMPGSLDGLVPITIQQLPTYQTIARHTFGDWSQRTDPLGKFRAISTLPNIQ